LRRVLHARPLARAISHLLVLALVTASAALAIAAARTPAPPIASSVGVSFDIVSRVRGAAPSQRARAPVTYELAAQPERTLPPQRDTEAQVPRYEPLPTPVPPAAPQTAVAQVQAPVVAATQPPIVSGSAQLLWPVPGGTITTYFSSWHLALDIAAPYGSAVIAADGGVVTFAGWRNNGGGLVVAVDHGNGIQTVYNHLGVIQVGLGQQVTRGQLLASVGCTGVCTGPHVHFEVVVGGILVNPLRYL
jgi:murein DD-endopeptidase MepM/ murein hydrolase activator NlpD